MLMEMGNPLRLLEKYVGWRVSGELIIVAAGDQRKVKFFLQQGRVAWASDSAASINLCDYLMIYCDLKRPVVQALFDDCVRKRKHFAQAIVDEHLAPIENIRRAIHAQIRGTMDVVRHIDHAQTLFVPHDTFDAYRADLTFDFPTLNTKIAEVT